MGAEKRVLWISKGATLCHWQGNVMESSTTYSAEKEQLQLLGERLAAQSHVPTYVVVDMVEEEYNTANVPHVKGRDRAVVTHRQLERAFKGVAYRYAQVQGRESTGRRDDVLLCSAITKAELLDPYLQVLRDRQVSIRGVYSLPFVTEALVSQLKLAKSAILLATAHRSGLRFSFILNGKLKLSRILPSAAGVDGFTSAVVLDELEKTQRYLVRLRVIPNDTELRALVISPTCLNDQLAGAGPRIGNMELMRFTVGAAAEVLGLKDLAGVDDNDVLLMALLFKSHLPNHYGTAQDLRWSRLRDWNTRLQLAGGTFFLLCAMQAASAFVEGLVLTRHGELAQKEASALLGQYDSLASGLLPSPVNADQLKTGLDALAEIERTRISIPTVVGVVSRAVSLRPDVAVDSLEIREEPAGPLLDGAGQLMAPAPEATNGNNLANPKLSDFVVSLRGQIVAFDGNYKHAAAQVESTVAVMEHEGVLVGGKVVQAPLDVSSQRSLAGEAGVRETQQRVAAFTIEGRWNEAGISK